MRERFVVAEDERGRFAVVRERRHPDRTERRVYGAYRTFAAADYRLRQVLASQNVPRERGVGPCPR